MFAPILATKLYIPSPRPRAVPRPRLLERLNEGLRRDQGFARKLTLISAPAGFGKTALMGAWAAGFERSEPRIRVAWLSLEEGDSAPARFLAYLIAALQTIAADVGAGLLVSLQAPQPPPLEVILTALLNEIAAIPAEFVLVLDDYHLVDSQQVDHAIAFLIEHLPPRMHLAIATREDPQIPLARLRGRGQLAELRAADLRFTPAEAAEFLNQVMGLNLPAEGIAALEDRTEGWIAGLQLAALALQGEPPAQEGGEQPGNRTGFINALTGGHRFVLDYLLEEVLAQQPESMQTFLLRTSILERMCGALCEAVAYGGGPAVPASGQETLERLERANLFVVPLDGERRWYRYHHLFGELLRQRLQSRASLAGPRPTGPREAEPDVAELHIRASAWYEANGLGLEAFQHAAAANDVERAERLVDEGRVPTHFPAAVTTVLNWLASLPKSIRDARPSLWVKSATLALVVGQTTGVDERLDAAEAALKGVEPLAYPPHDACAPHGACAPVQAVQAVQAGQAGQADAAIRDLYGQIAEARATLALARYQVETAIVQARRALEYLHPAHLSLRSSTGWVLGTAYALAGDRVAARQALTDALAMGEAAEHGFSMLLATIGLGQVQEAENQLHEAAETYRRAVQLAGDPALSIACQAQLGLGRIAYEWNDLAAAQDHGEQSLQLALQYDKAVDEFVASEAFLARLKLARGDHDGAAAMLARVEQSARERRSLYRLPEIAAVQVALLLRHACPAPGQVRGGDIAAAAKLAQAYDLPLSRARVLLAQGDAAAALAVLEPLREQMEHRGWADERLKATVLISVALHTKGEKDRAVQVLCAALALAEQGGFIRLFLDEGPAMAQLLAEVAESSLMARYAGTLLAAFKAASGGGEEALPSPAQPLIPRPRGSSSFSAPRDPGVEPLSQRELEILRLIAQGLSNRQIAERLFLALDTVKGHNRVIFDKLQVQNRTEAVARARELELL